MLLHGSAKLFYRPWQTSLSLDAGYSLWTNRSFKTPLLTAALVCIVGNVVYAVGYDVKALWILLASRLLVGFGKPCFGLAVP